LPLFRDHAIANTVVMFRTIKKSIVLTDGYPLFRF